MEEGWWRFFRTGHGSSSTSGSVGVLFIPGRPLFLLFLPGPRSPAVGVVVVVGGSTVVMRRVPGLIIQTREGDVYG